MSIPIKLNDDTNDVKKVDRYDVCTMYISRYIEARHEYYMFLFSLYLIDPSHNIIYYIELL